MTVSGRCLQNGCLADGKKLQKGNSCYKRGFTLVELIVVIVIIGILTTLAVPNMREWAREGKVNSKATEVRNLFELVRSKAVSSGKPGYIIGTNNLQVGLDNNAIALDAAVQASPNVVFAFIDLDQDQSFNGANDELVGLVEMDDVQSRFPSVFGVLPNGMSGTIEASNSLWYTRLQNAADYNFNVCIGANSTDFFNHAFTVSSAGQIVENKNRGATNNCGARP